MPNEKKTNINQKKLDNTINSLGMDNKIKNQDAVDQKTANTPINYADLDDEDKKHDIVNKEILYNTTICIIRTLYTFAVVGLCLSYGKVFISENTMEHWILLTFALVLLSIPVTLHVTLINKLYNRDKANKSSEIEHPIFTSISNLINIIINKLK